MLARSQGGRQRKRLVGSQKVELNPGEAKVVNIKLERLAMSIWNEAGKRWDLPSGIYSVEAGSSSADLPLSATFRVK